MSGPLTPAQQAWIDEAMPEGTDTPCGHYDHTPDKTAHHTSKEK